MVGNEVERDGLARADQQVKFLRLPAGEIRNSPRFLAHVLYHDSVTNIAALEYMREYGVSEVTQTDRLQ